MYTNPAPMRFVGMALGVIDKWLALSLAQGVLASSAVSDKEYIRC